MTLSHPVGDDRDEITVDYAGANAPAPNHQVILTGNGGNPFTESGWTGWTALDNGYALADSDPSCRRAPSLTIAPCFQTGVLSYTFDGTAEPTSPTDFCGTASDAADLDLTLDGIGAIGKSSPFTVTTNDNRAFQPADTATPNSDGGLVSLTVRCGRAGLVQPVPEPVARVHAHGVPHLHGRSRLQTVPAQGSCPAVRTRSPTGREACLGDGDRLAPVSPGTVHRAAAIRRGDTVTLSNGSRVLTTLHVANLQVQSTAATMPAGGKCSAGRVLGPLDAAPTNWRRASPPRRDGGGAADTGEICPVERDATGLPTTTIAQTDERSGGQTMTEVADVADTSPVEGETVYGAFTALAIELPDRSACSTDRRCASPTRRRPAARGVPQRPTSTQPTGSR